jgi:hypothetical protein
MVVRELSAGPVPSGFILRQQVDASASPLLKLPKDFVSVRRGNVRDD